MLYLVKSEFESPIFYGCWAKGKPGQKSFGDHSHHSFLKRRAKFVKKCKTDEFLDLLDAYNRFVVTKSLFTGLYGQIITWLCV